MTFHITRDKKQAESFEVSIDSKKYSMKKFKHISPRVIRALSGDEVSEMDSLFGLFEEACPGLFDAFESIDELQETFKAWQEDSEVVLGESEAS